MRQSQFRALVAGSRLEALRQCEVRGVAVVKSRPTSGGNTLLIVQSDPEVLNKWVDERSILSPNTEFPDGKLVWWDQDGTLENMN